MSSLFRCSACSGVNRFQVGFPARTTIGRCTHYKTDCNEPYVREEVLEEQFTDILRRLHFDEEVLDWIRTALKESHDDETRYHREVVDKLQKEYKRLEAMYVDKLDGKVGERFYEQKSVAWREEQKDPPRTQPSS